MIMAAAALLEQNPKPTDADIDARDHQHLPLRHLQPRARRDQARRRAAATSARAEAGGSSDHDDDARRLAPHVPRRHRRRRRRPDARLPRAVRRRGRRPPTARAGDQRLGGGPARRHRGDPHRPLRDGPGHAHRPRPARRRGAGLRLGEGHDRISDARPEPRAQPRLGQLLDRRQPRHPRVARVCPQGRRRRARDADPGRGARAGACRPPNAARQASVITHAALGPQHDLRQGRRPRRRRCEPPQEVHAQGPEGLEDRRQAAASGSTRPTS